MNTPTLSWRAFRADKTGAIVFGQTDGAAYWAAVDVTLEPAHKSIRLERPYVVTRAPAPQKGEAALCHVIRSAGRRALLVIQSEEADAVIDMVAHLDADEALRLHTLWRAE